MSTLAYSSLPVKDQRKVKETAESILALQSMKGEELQAVAEWISRFEHRTNQQTIMRKIILPLFREWSQAYEDKRFDLRNEATVTFAYEAMKNFHGFPLI